MAGRGVLASTCSVPLVVIGVMSSLRCTSCGMRFRRGVSVRCCGRIVESCGEQMSDHRPTTIRHVILHVGGRLGHPFLSIFSPNTYYMYEKVSSSELNCRLFSFFDCSVLLRCLICFKTEESRILEHLLSCSAVIVGQKGAKTSSSSQNKSRNREDDDSTCTSAAMDRKLPAKRNSDSSEDTRKGEIDAAAASLLASLKSSPSNKGSANPPRAAASAGIAAAVASGSASAASSKSSESEDDAQGEQKPTSMRHTSFDSRYECPCCQQVFLTAQTSWKKIQTHVTSCVDLNESIDSAKIMASALVTMKTSPETPNLRASRKRRLAPKAAAAAATAAATAASEGKKKVPSTTTRKVTAANKVVKSSKNCSAKKKPPKPRPSIRRDRNASAISAASEKKKRAQDIQSILSSKELRQALNEMAMDGLDLFS